MSVVRQFINNKQMATTGIPSTFPIKHWAGKRKEDVCYVADLAVKSNDMNHEVVFQ